MIEPTPVAAEPTDAERLRELLAAIEHERWAHWQRYMHSKCLGSLPPGDYVIPGPLFERWERQIATPYVELSEVEKASDREQVDQYWPLIEALLAERDEARRVIRNAHRAIREKTTVAEVALAMFDTRDNAGPSLLDELAEARAEVERLHQEILRLKAGHADLAAMHAEAVASQPVVACCQPTQILDEYRTISAPCSLPADHEGDHQTENGTPWRWYGQGMAMNVPAGADLHMTVRQAEEGSDG